MILQTCLHIMIFQFLLLLSLVYATPEARQFILEAKNDNQALVAKFINCSMIDITFLSQLKPVESDVIYLSASDGSEDIITEITAQSKFDLERIFSKICSVPLTYNHILNKSSADQVFKLIDSGSPSNRIDVVLMGDGYQLNQKQKFLDDMNRLVSEMWNDVTFKSFVPLVNVWAVFRPSTDAGKTS